MTSKPRDRSPWRKSQKYQADPDVVERLALHPDPDQRWPCCIAYDIGKEVTKYKRWSIEQEHSRRRLEQLQREYDQKHNYIDNWSPTIVRDAKVLEEGKLAHDIHKHLVDIFTTATLKAGTLSSCA